MSVSANTTSAVRDRAFGYIRDSAFVKWLHYIVTKKYQSQPYLSPSKPPNPSGTSAVDQIPEVLSSSLPIVSKLNVIVTMVCATVIGILASFLLFLHHVPTVSAGDDPIDSNLVQQLRMKVTNLERLDLLSSDSQWHYNFCRHPRYSWLPGSVCNASPATWPAMTGTGMTVAQLNLGPCAQLPPHLHPRAINIVVMAKGGSTATWMMLENGARVVQEVLSEGQMTIFPQGSLHFMANQGCENNTLYSFLNSEDGGTTNVANSLLALGQQISMHTIPFLNVDTSDGNNDDAWQQAVNKVQPVGNGSVWGFDECLARCGIQNPDNGHGKRSQSESQSENGDGGGGIVRMGRNNRW